MGSLKSFFHDGATAYFDAGGAESGIAFRIDNTASGYPAPSYPERMRIATSGDVCIAYTAPVNIGSGYYNLHVGR